VQASKQLVGRRRHALQPNDGNWSRDTMTLLLLVVVSGTNYKNTLCMKLLQDLESHTGKLVVISTRNICFLTFRFTFRVNRIFSHPVSRFKTL